MEVQLQRSVYISQQEFMEIKSMAILKGGGIGKNDCHQVNWKGVGFYVFVVKYPNCNIIMMSTYSGIIVCDDQN